MVAPVLTRAKRSTSIFPKGDTWTDLWTGAEVGKAGQWSEHPAPIGKPAVFLRKGGEFNDEILAGLKAEGLLD